tara:strand:+ start:527 stop:706 length:180 start_codon:yes stop_codon:yes gene_type:complete
MCVTRVRTHVRLLKFYGIFCKFFFHFRRRRQKKNEPPTTKTLLLLKEETQRGEGEEYER